MFLGKIMTDFKFAKGIFAVFAEFLGKSLLLLQKTKLQGLLILLKSIVPTITNALS